MKQPKKLNRRQKIKLDKKGFDPDLYALKSETADTFTVCLKAPDPSNKNNELTFNK